MKIINNMSDKEYHKQLAPEDHFWSSSQLKDALSSYNTFYAKYISKTIPPPSSTALDIGTAVHTRILEPEHFDRSVAFWKSTRSGKKWEEFRELNPDKLIISGNLNIAKYTSAVENILSSPQIMELHTGGRSEVACFGMLKGTNIKVKCDYLNEDQKYIADIKTTTGCLSEADINYKTESSDYDLSAALYVDMFNAAGVSVEGFFWAYSSKDTKSSCIARASETTLDIGRAKYTKAIENIKHWDHLGWPKPDSVITTTASNKEMDKWLSWD